MRNIFFIVIIFFSSCNSADQQSETTTTATDNEKTIVRIDTVYLTRNVDITAANSYSDLFLDSNSVAEFIRTKKLSADETQGLQSFYNYRNLQFAWFTSQGFTEQAKGFWNLQDMFGSKPDKALRTKMDTLLNRDTLILSRFDTSILNTELSLTHAYLQFHKANRNKTLFANLSPEKTIPVKKENALSLSDTMLITNTDSVTGATAIQYSLLKKKQKVYLPLMRKQKSGMLW